jgi:hypothetical protein
MGDRMRAILFLTRLAIATKRVLLIDWTFPTDLRKHLVPHLINWSTEGLDVPPLSGYPDDAPAAAGQRPPSSVYIPLTSTVPFLANISTPERFNASYGQRPGPGCTCTLRWLPHPAAATCSTALQHLPSPKSISTPFPAGNVTFLRVQTNVPAQHPLDWLPKLDAADTAEASCWWNSLFKPSEALAEGGPPMWTVPWMPPQLLFWHPSCPATGT